MPRECASVDCKEQATKESPYSFHRFPSDPERKREWIVRMNRQDPETKKLWEPKPHDILCSEYFETECFTARSRFSTDMVIEYKPRLKPDAVPTLFQHKRKEVPERGAATKRRKREILDQALQGIETEEAGEGEEIPDTDNGSGHSVDLPQEPTSKDFHIQVDIRSQETTSVKCQTVLPPISVFTRAVQAACSTSDCAAQIESNKITFETQTEEPRLENLDEDESSETESDDECTNTHSSSERLTEDLQYRNPFRERKYIVFEEELKEFLNCCRCGCSSQNSSSHLFRTSCLRRTIVLSMLYLHT